MPPRKLIYALRVSLDNLRPWEYDAMVADEYDEILLCQRTFAKEMKFARKLVADEAARRTQGRS